MMARFRPAKGLNVRVARQIVAPRVQIAVRAGTDVSRAAAPAEKVWTSQDDGLVRPEHVDAHGQAVPRNLRFTLRSPRYDQEHYGAGTHQMGAEPRDPAFTPGLTANCRCFQRFRVDGVSGTIREKPIRVTGGLVTSGWVCDHDLAVPAEFGTSEDEAARFMGQGLRQAARRLR